MSEKPKQYSDYDDPPSRALQQADLRMQSLRCDRITFPEVIRFANKRGIRAFENAFSDEAVGVGDLLMRLLNNGNYRELDLKNFNPLNVPVYPGDSVIIIVPSVKKFGSQDFTFGRVFAGRVQDSELGQVITLDFYSRHKNLVPHITDRWRADLELKRKFPRRVLGFEIGWEMKAEVVPVKFGADAIFLVDFAPEV